MTYQPTKVSFVQFTYRDAQEAVDYLGMLTVEYGEEGGQWVGICRELGTATQGDTLAEAEADLRDAIDLQLNGMAEIADVREYLIENEVNFAPVSMPQDTGFALAGNVEGAYMVLP